MRLAQSAAGAPGTGFACAGGMADSRAPVRTIDWAATALGPVATWPHTLKAAVDLCVAANTPMALAWGDERTMIYNEAYEPLCGDRHPGCFGADFRQCWETAWPALGDAFSRAL